MSVFRSRWQRLLPALVVAALPASAQADAQADDQQESPQQILRRIDQRLLAWDTGRARELFDGLEDKGELAARVAGARILAQEGDPQAAGERLQEAADQAPADPMIAIHLGEAWVLARNAEGAREAFEQAAARARARLESNPDHRKALFALGVAQQRLRQFDEAVESLERALELAPGHAETLFQLGSIHAFARQWQPAVDRLTEALEADSDIAYAYFYRGLAAEKIGRKDLLLNDMRRFLALAPEAPDAARARRILEAAG